MRTSQPRLSESHAQSELCLTRTERGSDSESLVRRFRTRSDFGASICHQKAMSLEFGRNQWFALFCVRFLCLTHLLTRSLALALYMSHASLRTHTRTDAVTHSLTRSLTHSLTHPLTHSLTQSGGYVGCCGEVKAPLAPHGVVVQDIKDIIEDVGLCMLGMLRREGSQELPQDPAAFEALSLMASDCGECLVCLGAERNVGEAFLFFGGGSSKRQTELKT